MSEIWIDANKAERMIAQTLRDDFKMFPAQANAAAEHLCRRLKCAVPTPATDVAVPTDHALPTEGQRVQGSPGREDRRRERQGRMASLGIGLRSLGGSAADSCGGSEILMQPRSSFKHPVAGEQVNLILEVSNSRLL